MTDPITIFVAAVIGLLVLAGIIVIAVNASNKARNALADSGQMFPDGAGRPGYEPAPALMTPEEAYLYVHLVQLFDQAAIICPKVRLADVVRPQTLRNKSEWQNTFNRLTRKRLDFVCLRIDDLTTLGVIELDDAGPEQAGNAEHDEFVDSVLNAAGVPISRVQLLAQYDFTVLYNQVMRDFGINPEEATGNAEEATEALDSEL
ncbi:MAG: DUF2726 domain-containing protein [Methylacidiphilales bacterium]|nr:DUF2726 domain-containing protein [Candidatus Methylacidiphilales bacterium]